MGGPNLNTDSSSPLQLRLMLLWYPLVLIYCLVLQARRRSFDQSARAIAAEEKDRVTSFPRVVMTAIVLRIIWVLAVISGVFKKASDAICHDPHALVSLLSRLSQLLFFSAFSSVLVTWWDAIQTEARGGMHFPRDLLSVLRASSVGPPLMTSSELVPLSLVATICRPSTIHLLLNFWVFFIVVSLVFVEFYVCDSALSKQIDDTETVVVAFFYLILAAMFPYSYARLRSLLEGRFDLERKVRLVSAVCSVLFLVRSALFMLRPVFSTSLHGIAETILYPNFFFTLPELLPSLVVLALMVPSPEGRPAEAVPLLRGEQSTPPAASSPSSSLPLRTERF